MDTSALHIKRIGDRAVVAPAYQLEQIRDALQDRGTFPKLIGEIVPPEAAEPDEEDEEAEGEEAEGEEDKSEEDGD